MYLSVLFLASCSQDLTGDLAHTCADTESTEVYGSGTSNNTKGNNNALSSSWGLNSVWDASQSDFVACTDACNCYDVVEITAVNQTAYDDLADAIVNETVDDFFAESNRATWELLFEDDMCDQVLSDLQNGVATLEDVLAAGGSGDEARYKIGFEDNSPNQGDLTYHPDDFQCD